MASITFQTYYNTFTNDSFLLRNCGGSVAYITVRDQNGDEQIGTCFHIGNGAFLTARHVVENQEIIKIATTPAGITLDTFGGHSAFSTPQSTASYEGPYFHPDEGCDLAVIKPKEILCPAISLCPTLEDVFGSEVLLLPVTIMGYPPIHGGVGVTDLPPLLCVKAEINAACKSYLNKQRYYIASCLARGGFSGGPVFTPKGFCMGVVVQSMGPKDKAAELGFMAILSTRDIATLLDHHSMLTDNMRKHLWQPL